MEGMEGPDVRITKETVAGDKFCLLLICRSLLMLVGGSGPQGQPICILFQMTIVHHWAPRAQTLHQFLKLLVIVCRNELAKEKIQDTKFKFRRALCKNT